MRTANIALAAAIFCLAVQGFASDVIEDAVKLTNSGIAEEVVVAWASKQHTLDITVKNIVTLKEGKVSDKVILALIKASETAAPAEQRWLNRDGVVESAPPPARTAPQAGVARAEQAYDDRTPTPAPATTYIAPSSVSYVDYTYGYPAYYYSYPYYSSCGYYGYGYPRCYGYPYYGGIGLSFGFNFGGGHHYHNYGGGYYRGGYGGGYYGGGGGYRGGSGGFRGGTGFSSGGGFRSGHR